MKESLDRRNFRISLMIHEKLLFLTNPFRLCGTSRRNPSLQTREGWLDEGETGELWCSISLLSISFN